jgi:hypothetical protein
MTAVMAADAPTAATGASRRRARIATGIATAIVALSILGWLVWPSPPGPTVLQTGTPHYVVTATLESPRLGMTGVDIEVAARDPHAATTTVGAVQVQAVMPLMGYATEPITTTPAPGSGHSRATGLPLMMTGPWQLLVAIPYSGGTDHLVLPFWVSG